MQKVSGPVRSILAGHGPILGEVFNRIVTAVAVR